MDKKISKAKITQFTQKVREIMNRELELRGELKHTYDQFVLDAQDKVIACRYAQQAYFSIQKERLKKLMAERLEFHPFWGANPFQSQEEMDDFVEGEDDED